MPDRSSRFTDLSRDSANTAAYYSTLGMNAVIFVALALFAGFFVGEGMRLSSIGTAVLHKVFEATR